MALNKSIAIKGGYTAEYWRIGEIVFDRVHNLINIRMDAYKDAATRQEGIELSVASTSYSIPVEIPSDDVTVDDAYTHVKEVEQFSGAIDI